MDHIVFLVFRRMRVPLLALVSVYSVAVAGMVLIPGQDAAGEPVAMSFFHAFYFVSYTSTTIGFGEIPNAFTDAQRLWVSFCVFLTVAVWIYAIGTLIALLQNPTFQRAIRQSSFRRQVRGLRDPFYLVCGHGQTGGALVRGLTDRHQRAVVIDIDPERINLLELDDQREYVPALCADARRPSNLESAGLGHRLCRGVVALTNVNETNLKIAIAAKLLKPSIQVICRADSHDIEANMASFGTDHIYDPFDTYARYLSNAIRTPCLTLLQDWLSKPADSPLSEPVFPPAGGKWVLCGYGRFGKAIHRYLEEQGMALTVIEAEPHRTGIPSGGVIHGRGTEAVTLQQADIEDAVGLVAGTDKDADNLSIIMTARALNPRLFVVARQNLADNSSLFDLVGATLVMNPSRVIAERIRMRLGTPLLADFMASARDNEDQWACALVGRILGLVEDRVPHVWELRVDPSHAEAVCRACEQGTRISLGDLMRDPREREQVLPVLPLMFEHGGSRSLLPAAGTRIQPGDRLLFCGLESARGRMQWTLQDQDVLRYVLTGDLAPEGVVWRWLSRHLTRVTRRA